MQFRFEQNQSVGVDSENFTISAIARDLYNLIYSKPYPGHSGSGRMLHGIAHVSRASLMGAAGYNIMATAGVEGTQTLTPEEKSRELRLIQIALLLHDSGREGDGEDLWDNDSGLNVYHYLTERLGVGAEEACTVAEAMANKDWPEKPYQKLVIDTNGTASFQEQPAQSENPFSEKGNRMRLAIHFGDCIEYLRIDHPFDIRRLALANQHYPEPQQHIIDSNARKMYQDALVVISNYHDNQWRSESGYDSENAYDLAAHDADTLTHTLAYFYPDPGALTLDPEAKIPWVRENETDGYLIKKVGYTQRSWADFIPHLIRHKPLEFRKKDQRLPYTYRQKLNSNTGEYDIEVIPTRKKNPLRQPFLNADDKAALTRTTAMGFYTDDYKPKTIALDNGVQVGIRIPLKGAVIHRIFQYDIASHARSYDSYAPTTALKHAQGHTVKSFNELVHPSTQKGVSILPNNEVMASIAWDEENDACRVMIFADNMDSRLFAQARAIDIALNVNAERIQQGMQPLHDYRPTIMFYPSLEIYSTEDQASDRQKVLASQDNGKDLSSMKPNPLNLNLIACAIHVMQGMKGVSIEQCLQFLMIFGISYSYEFNLSMVKHIMAESPDDENVHKQALLALNPHVKIELLRDTHHPLSPKMIDLVFSTSNAKDFIQSLTEPLWKELITNPMIQAKMQGMLSISSNLTELFDDTTQNIAMINIMLETLPSFDIHSALQHAFNKNQPELIKLLLKRGADTSTLGNVNNKLFIAIKLNLPSLIDECIETAAQSNERDTEGNTILHMACQKNNTQLAEKIITLNKSLINTANNENETPLIIACKHENIEMVKSLLDNGADPNCADKRGLTPLHIIIFMPDINLAIATLLIDHKENPNVPDNTRRTPLEYAIYFQSYDYAKFLLSHGANPNTIDQGLGRPLFFGVDAALGMRGIKLFLDHGFKFSSTAELGLSLLTIRKKDWCDYFYCMKSDDIKHLISDGKDLFVIMTKIGKNDTPILIEALQKTIGEAYVETLLNDPQAKLWLAHFMPQELNNKEKNDKNHPI